jgi:PAS domain S-box-containing protein
MANVLIAVDEQDIRESLVAMLRRASHHCTAPDNPTSADSLFAEHNFDVAVVEVAQGRDSGMDLAHRIRELSANTQLVLVSAEPDFGLAREALRLRAFDHLIKPVDETEILEAVASAAEENHRRQEYDRLGVANELKESETEYRALYDNALVGLFRVSIEDGKPLAANEVAAQLFGYGSVDAFVREFRSLKHYVNAEDREPILQELREKGHIQRVEILSKKVDGSHFWSRASFRFEEQGEYLDCVAIDVTEWKLAELALQASEEKLNSVLEHTEVGIAVIQDGQRVFYNPIMYKMLGYSKREYADMPFLSTLHQDDIEFVAEQIEQRIVDAVSDSKPVEFRVVTESGETKWVEANTVRVTWDGRPAIQTYVHDITERKLALKALASSEERFRKMMEQSPVSIQVHGLDGKLLRSNTAYAELYGLGEEALAELYEKYDVRNDEQAKALGLIPLIERTYAGESVVFPTYEYDGTNTLRTLDIGKLISRRCWIRTRGFPLKDDDGAVTSVVFMSEDITESRLAEEKLKASDARYRRIFETATEGIWSMDRGHRTTFVNEHMLNMLGCQSEDVIGKLVEDFMFEEDLSAHQERMAQRHKKMSGNYEHRFRRSDGTALWTLVSATVLTNENGDFDGSFGMFTDITERKSAEDALHASEMRFSAVFQNSPLAIALTSLEASQLVEVNPAWQEITGYTHDEAIGKTAIDLNLYVRPEQRTQLISELQKHGKIREFELRLRNKSGDIVDILFSAELIELEAESLMLSMGVDVTERKRAEEQLREAFDEIKILKERTENENIHLRDEIQMAHLHGNIIGESRVMKAMMMHAEQVAPTDSTVLIQGETGTGKELLARAIHSMSPRKDKPLIVVNCATMPASLVENELFGREKGAYTGAVTRQFGRFEVADGGTLFLDEIGELPPDTQAKLLRVLQEGQFERLGSTKTISVDVRIIAATNRDLEQLVKQGDFRDDLYYRLSVFPITTPPLRDRREDIPQLVWAFVRELSERMGKVIESVPHKTMDAVQHNTWPGNVRELRNVVERAMILSRGPTLDIQIPDTTEPSDTDAKTLDEVQRLHIIEVLERAGWRIRGENGAAAVLGVNESTLRSRMKKLGITRPA